jgi:hypothetical protein
MAKNLFESAKVVGKGGKGKKPEKEVLEVPKLLNYTILDSLEKSVKTLKASIKGEIDNVILEAAAEKGALANAKPENFTGQDGIATASLEIKKRGTNSPLNENEIELLVEAGLPYSEASETFVINPAYQNDAKLLAKVSEALSKVKDLPEDFIVKDESTAKATVSDNTVSELFKKPKDVIDALIAVVMTPAVKPKLTEAKDFLWLLGNAYAIKEAVNDKQRASMVEAFKESVKV